MLKIVLISIVTIVSIALAEVTPIAKKQPDSELSILGITLGKSTLDDVKAKFKSKEIYHEGDAGTGLFVLCFKAPNGSTIAFESDEKIGSSKTVNSISINDKMRPYRLNSVCEKTSQIKSKLSINGVSTGMSPLLIKRVKGKPSLEAPNSLLYQYEVKEKTEKGEMKVTSSLAIEFKQEYAVMITASKVENYLE